MAVHVGRGGGGPVLAVLCTAQFLVVANITLVTILLPALQRDLGFAGGGVQWVVSTYTLTFGCSLVIAGRLADLFGHRRVLGAGLCSFALGSLGCGLAGHPAVLLISRGAQGLGAAAVAAAALALLIRQFTRDRPRALAWWSASQALGGASGWLLGGVLSEVVGWRGVFLGNAALALLCAVLSPLLMPVGSRSARRVDVAGGALITLAMFLLVLGLTEAADPRTGPALLAGGALALVGFALVERRATDPVVPLVALRSRSLVTGTAVIALINAITTPVLTLCALHLQGARGVGAAWSGALFVPFNLAVIAGSVLAARRVGGRRGARLAVMAAAVGAIAAGAGVLVLLPSTGAFVVPVLVGFALLGLGGGSASVAANAEGTAGIAPGTADERGGVAGGLLNTATELGVALGMAVFVTVGTGQGGLRAALTAAAGTGLLIALGLLVLARRQVPAAMAVDS
ncbi:MFS transporter [Saccharothrix coeruleofusca]|uniref:MFS transporter n=1 Tax=Saccharothrix coeruleofusca TaxID=33919 RepID=UPI00166F9671|nr:MFS transporter [Saccharothrix coeruleofusca]